MIVRVSHDSNQKQLRVSFRVKPFLQNDNSVLPLLRTTKSKVLKSVLFSRKASLKFVTSIENSVSLKVKTIPDFNFDI